MTFDHDIPLTLTCGPNDAVTKSRHQFNVSRLQFVDTEIIKECITIPNTPLLSLLSHNNLLRSLNLNKPTTVNLNLKASELLTLLSKISVSLVVFHTEVIGHWKPLANLYTISDDLYFLSLDIESFYYSLCWPWMGFFSIGTRKIQVFQMTLIS